MRKCARQRSCVRAAVVDTRGSNDGLHFHGCIGKNHLPIFADIPLCIESNKRFCFLLYITILFIKLHVNRIRIILFYCTYIQKNNNGSNKTISYLLFSFFWVNKIGK